MRSSGKRRGAGERVLEGRHVIGLFMLMLLFSGAFFTLGYLMGRDQAGGPVRAATTARGFGEPDVLPKAEPAPKSSAASKKKDVSEPAGDSGLPTTSDWEFYHAGDSSKPDDHLKPLASPSPSGGIKGGAGRQGNSSRTNVGPALGSGGGTNLQVSATTREADAMALANSLRKRNFPAFVQPPQGDRFYHVLVGPFPDQKAVDSARKGLEAAGFNKVIVKH